MNETFAEIRRLMLATNRIDGAYYLLSRKLRVKENILALLYALDDEETHSQKRICEDWLFPKTTINTIIRELVQAGYVTLCREENGREKRIALTQAGKDYASKMLKGVYQAEQAAMEKTLQRFSPQFVDALDYFADCICRELDHRLPEPKKQKGVPNLGEGGVEA